MTIGLLAVLSAIFAIELKTSASAVHPLNVDSRSFVALGGLGRAFVWQHGEWWRFFTAPWLHAGLDHLASNGFVLLVVGTMLERLIGRAWLAAAFFAGAWGGSIGSLVLSGVSLTTSVGASGAIMALVALLFTLSFHSEATLRARRYRRIALGLLIPALVPSVARDGALIDIGCHFGGVVAGTAIGFYLLIIWPETGEKPPGTRIAGSAAGISILVSVVAFLFTALHYPAYAAADAQLAPRELALDLARNKRTDELVAEYPHDPLAHFLRAADFLDNREASSAIGEIRAALDEHEALQNHYPERFRQELQIMLAVALELDNRTDEAREAASPLCSISTGRTSNADQDARLTNELNYLHAQGLCV
jgi:rhomboid protease GluP